MLKVVVDRTKWLRGEGSQASYLRRETDGKMCCVGFAGLAGGLTKEQITGLKAVVFPEDSTESWRHVYAPLRLERAFLPGEFQNLYTINDRTSLNDAEREAKIIELGAPLGIEFSFVN